MKVALCASIFTAAIGFAAGALIVNAIHNAASKTMAVPAEVQPAAAATHDFRKTPKGYCDPSCCASSPPPSAPGSHRSSNQVIENAVGVGGWGGLCTCPDGSAYQV